MRMITAALALVAVLAVAACAARPRAEAEGEVVRDGMLMVRLPGYCATPEGCEPGYRLFDSTFSQWVPLLGDVRAEHAELVVAVRGSWRQLSDAEADRHGYRPGAQAIEVESSQVRSVIPYQDFLIEQANRYTRRKFGCELFWDVAFSWHVDESHTSLIVRMTDMTDKQNEPFLELRYDGNSGALLGERVKPDGLDPCRRT